MSTAHQWFKSSYSSDEGVNCIETAYTWRKSSYSSDQGGACVEIAACPDTIHVRDSKNPIGPELAVAPSTWAAFTTYVAEG
ncbi:DUF397 domain-containing protein [Streptomyces uncialis]|uniref:DUF397 domain-containing protein n=1 Tax=Streptomyces uncialis TaxID=1048205 RepID=UPI00386F5B3D|nr:DUF397 domain-containing protein [Streptomyces uncialis]